MYLWLKNTDINRNKPVWVTEHKFWKYFGKGAQQGVQPVFYYKTKKGFKKWTVSIKQPLASKAIHHTLRGSHRTLALNIHSIPLFNNYRHKLWLLKLTIHEPFMISMRICFSVLVHVITALTALFSFASQVLERSKSSEYDLHLWSACCSDSLWINQTGSFCHRIIISGTDLRGRHVFILS